MICPSCRNDDFAEGTTAYFADLKGCYVIIENVPCLECTQCGEKIFSASVMSRIDMIIAGIKNVASKIFIMDYKAA